MSKEDAKASIRLAVKELSGKVSILELNAPGNNGSGRRSIC
jgi:hypothetical protein